jgi:hypothetical protein
LKKIAVQKIGDLFLINLGKLEHIDLLSGQINPTNLLSIAGLHRPIETQFAINLT